MNERVDYERVDIGLKVGRHVSEKRSFGYARLRAMFQYIFRQLKWFLLCCY
jgi:hypothetical protein